MKALPFTHRVKGRYWYFRHPRVGHVRIVGEAGTPFFMRQYRKWLRYAGHTLKSAGAVRALDKAGQRGAAFHVYFAQAGEDGPIKIGCALDVDKRLRSLQTGCVEPLRLLAAIEGGPKEERRLHGLFADDRIRGEWFQPSDSLCGHIGNIAETEFFDGNSQGTKVENPALTP